MTSVPRVVVTNDDGIDAPGLVELAAAAVAAGLDVTVVAPDEEASGASAGLSAVYREGKLALHQAELPGLDIPVYCVQASPSYIAILAGLGTFGRRPELLLSGINRGANAGHAIVHSGTVGAAFTAANYGIRAMAVSLDVLDAATADPATGGATLVDQLARLRDDDLYWDTAGVVVQRLLPLLHDLPEDTILNVNVPNRPLETVAGLRQVGLAPFGQVRMAVAESGANYVRITIEAATDRRLHGTDIGALADGYVSVTPIGTMRALDLDLHLPSSTVDVVA